MFKKLLLLACFFLILQQSYSQEFTSQQKAWLYKIVTKTPTLHRNWKDFFNYKGPIPQVNEKFESVRKQIVLEIIEDSIINNPSLLTIDFESISKTSPGLMADAAVKLALWELYESLKSGFEEAEPFTINPTANYFFKEMFKVLPADYRKSGEVRKKYLPLFYNLLNPSYPFFSKSESLSQIKNISVQNQKRLLDKWHSLVKKYVEENSEAYFKILSGKEIFFRGYLLAAGEGSGSSGLLREYEKGGEGEVQTGTGKGIGLFTYTVDVKKDKIVPNIEGNVKAKTLKDEPTLFHLTLWGMDSNKKPLILLSKGNKSYIMFAGCGHITPDSEMCPGVTYLDRLSEFEEEKINKKLKELKKEGGLLSIYDKEVRKKEVIQDQIRTLELELDSLNKIPDASVVAKNTRKSRIDVCLSNLTDKERRLADVQSKISAEYRKIDQSKNKLKKMNALLGDNVQAWSVNDSIYTFSDGTIFNYYTQDLIFFPDSDKNERIKVDLLAASFSLNSKRKDEVQLYVNTTGGVENNLKSTAPATYLVLSDTLIKKSCFFDPNEFNVNSVFSRNEQDKLYKISRDIKSGSKQLQIKLVAIGIDTLNHSSISKDKLNYLKKKDLEQFKKSRRADIMVIDEGDTLKVEIQGYTDAGNTRLSALSLQLRKHYSSYTHKLQTHNPILSALRINSVLNELGNAMNLKFDDEIIEVLPLSKNIRVQKLLLIPD